METKELIKKIRKIEIKTKVLSGNIFAGQYLSSFKGKGMSFSEVREYQYGDEVRNIDWNVTARFNHPYVKVFEEERELTVVLLIDLSGSLSFGTNKQLKRELVAEVSAVLAFSALLNNDKISALLFTDKVEKFIPPKKGKKHVLRIISEILNFNPQSSKTNISSSLYFLINAIKKRSIIFLLSDFLSKIDFEDKLKIISKKHDLIVIKINDIKEQQIYNLGLTYIHDPENKKNYLVDFSDKKFQLAFQSWLNEHNKNLDTLFKKYNINYINLYTGEDYVKPLIKLFEMR